MILRPVHALCVVAAFCALCVSAQEPVAKPHPDLEVIRSEWKYAGYSRIDVVDSSRGVGGVEFKVQRSKEYGFKYTATAVVRNNTSREISQFDWQVQFTDKKSKQLVKAFKTRSKIEIKPGQAIAVERSFYLDKDVSMQAIDNADRTTQVSNIEFAGN